MMTAKENENQGDFVAAAPANDRTWHILFTLIACVFYAVVAIGISVSVAGGRAPKLGYVDVQAVMGESRALQGILQASDASTARERDAVAAADKKASAPGATNADVDAAKAAHDALDRAINNQKKLASDSANDKLVKAIEVVARRRGITMLFGRPAFAVPDTDMTGDVVAQLDGGGPELARARQAARAALDQVRLLEAAVTKDGGAR